MAKWIQYRGVSGETVRSNMIKDVSSTLPPYRLDKDFYDKVRAAKSTYKLVTEFIIPPYSGRGFLVNKGQTFRVIEEDGPQVADVVLWNAHNQREFFSMARSWLMEGFFVGVYTRLWSEVPWFRPMAVCVEETVDTRQREEASRHHYFQTHCTAEVMEARLGRTGLNACRLNLLQAIEPYGLKEEDLHDNINVHEKARLDPQNGKIISGRTEAQKGDYIEFYATIDLLVAVSVCPTGDNTAFQSAVVRPIKIQVYETGIPPKEFPKWTDWRLTWKGRWLPT